MNFEIFLKSGFDFRKYHRFFRRSRLQTADIFVKNDEFFYCFAVQKRPFCPEKLTVLPLRTVFSKKVQMHRRDKMKPRVQNLPKYGVFCAASHQHMPSRSGKNSNGANVSIRSRTNYRRAKKSVIFTMVHKYSYHRLIIHPVCRLSSVKRNGNPWIFRFFGDILSICRGVLSAAAANIMSFPA